jgi:hypothetical protein
MLKLKFKQKNKPISRNEIRIKIDSNTIEINMGQGFQRRHNSTLSMLLDSLPNIGTLGKVNINIYTDDYHDNFSDDTFYFCVDNYEKISNCIPDFSFYSWAEVGIFSYKNLFNELLQVSQTEPLYDVLFWAGNINVHPSRKLFYDKFKNIPGYEIHFIDPDKDNYLQNIISLKDHAKYKYLIDIEGRGYSGRLKYLLMMGRVVFVQERKWKAYYEYELEPFIHYVPIRNDFADLDEKLDFVRANPSVYSEISNAGLRFAESNLNYEKICNVFQQKILKSQFLNPT